MSSIVRIMSTSHKRQCAFFAGAAHAAAARPPHHRYRITKMQADGMRVVSRHPTPAAPSPPPSLHSRRHPAHVRNTPAVGLSKTRRDESPPYRGPSENLVAAHLRNIRVVVRAVLCAACTGKGKEERGADGKKKTRENSAVTAQASYACRFCFSLRENQASTEQGRDERMTYVLLRILSASGKSVWNRHSSVGAFSARIENWGAGVGGTRSRQVRSGHCGA